MSDAGSLSEKRETLALHPGNIVEDPNILWVGAGAFFTRVVRDGAISRLLEEFNAQLTVVDVRPREELGKEIESLLNHDRVRYYNASVSEQRRNLFYNRKDESGRLFSHTYIANWPQAHLLSGVKYSILCPGGDIIVTKPMDLNIPMIETVASGVFPDLQEKMVVDDHYRNKGSVRELHRILPDLQVKYGKLRGFRIWLVEPVTIEEEKRLRALECGVIWDLATHFISLIQLYFLDPPYLGLAGYSNSDPERLRGVQLGIDKVLRTRYVGCELKSPTVETLAVIEVTIRFEYLTYDGWTPWQISGLLIVGKGATRGAGITGSIKQFDFNFEGASVNLNFDTGRLSPPFADFKASNEQGFHTSVIELLTHSHRELARNGNMNQAPSGRYHCGMPFGSGHGNVRFIDAIHRHPTSQELLRSYTAKDSIRSILDRMIGDQYLSRDWLDPRRFVDIV